MTPLRGSAPTLNPQPSTLNPQPSTLNPQPSTLNPQPSTLNPQPSTLLIPFPVRLVDLLRQFVGSGGLDQHAHVRVVASRGTDRPGDAFQQQQHLGVLLLGQ